MSFTKKTDNSYATDLFLLRNIHLDELLWLEDHRHELMANWEKAQKGEQLDKIEPLK